MCNPKCSSDISQLSTEKHGEQELDNLRDQNASLRMALAAMRQQMESLGHAVPSALAVDTPQYDHDNGEGFFLL